MCIYSHTIHIQANLSAAVKKNTIHNTGKQINVLQKMSTSAPADGALWECKELTIQWIIDNIIQTFLVSKTQVLVPSSSTLFHHLNPTNNLPVIFLITQKSRARRRIMIIKSSTKLLLNIYDAKTYNRIDSVRNNTWKKTAIGCL